ncbi:hypothetical protein M758_8G095700 [Ceratodon purpureus]|nr:hypothetical protein M758_8G095700 [Ceratodon purpureus]
MIEEIRVRQCMLLSDIARSSKSATRVIFWHARPWSIPAPYITRKENHHSAVKVKPVGEQASDRNHLPVANRLPVIGENCLECREFQLPKAEEVSRPMKTVAACKPGSPQISTMTLEETITPCGADSIRTANATQLHPTSEMKIELSDRKMHLSKYVDTAVTTFST